MTTKRKRGWFQKPHEFSFQLHFDIGWYPWTGLTLLHLEILDSIDTYVKTILSIQILKFELDIWLTPNRD